MKLNPDLMKPGYGINPGRLNHPGPAKPYVPRYFQLGMTLTRGKGYKTATEAKDHATKVIERYKRLRAAQETVVEAAMVARAISQGEGSKP